MRGLNFGKALILIIITMGKVQSQNLVNVYKTEDQKEFLLDLVFNQFDEFRRAVEANRDLQDNFRKITHYPEGKFFASSHEAAGYLKEEVFHDNERTERVFRIVASYYRDNLEDWRRSPDSESELDDAQPQDMGKSDSCESEEESKAMYKPNNYTRGFSRQHSS